MTKNAEFFQSRFEFHSEELQAIDLVMEQVSGVLNYCFVRNITGDFYDGLEQLYHDLKIKRIRLLSVIDAQL